MYHVSTMKRSIFLLAAGLALAACNSDKDDEAAGNTAAPDTAPEVSFEPGEAADHAVKPQGPVQIAYKIIGSPIIGQPVAIELEIISHVRSKDITLSYRINDSTALQMPEAQPPSVAIVARSDQQPVREQVRVIPLREGRLYLNVSAQVQTDNGSLSTVSAIPIQVGTEASGEPQQNGQVETDENGDPIRVLEGKD